MMNFLWDLSAALQPYDSILKLISYVLGPLLALAAFWLNRRDRLDLKEQIEIVGRAKERADQAQREADRVRRDVERKSKEVVRLRSELEGITKGGSQLWKLRPPQPFGEYRHWFLEDGAKLVTIGNLKGGVGKTTIAANFAAYVSETLHKRVLLIDLDYQGSLSNMLLLALQREETDSRVDRLFTPDANLATLLQARLQLVPQSVEGPRLSRGWLVPASYSFAEIENQLLLRWLLNSDEGVDVRYRLARVLLNPDVRRDYDVIIFDMPPRMTLGAVNALVASHHLFVPTVLDKLSVEAVPQFLSNIMEIKKDLNIGIELAGVIGTLTRRDELAASELRYFNQAREAGEIWSKERQYMLQRTIPRRAAIADASGDEIAYLLTASSARESLRAIFDPLFEDMCERISL